jgi:hypothetical protein
VTTTYPGGNGGRLTYDADSNIGNRKTRAGATIRVEYKRILSTDGSLSEGGLVENPRVDGRATDIWILFHERDTADFKTAS